MAPKKSHTGRERTARARRVFCPIARATVRVALRNGRGFQEPGRLYVRCEDRDCQYVDLNEPPCPLHVDMFRESSDDLMRAALLRFGGAPVCYGCLGAMLDLSHDRVRGAAWRLTDLPGYRVDVRPTRCAHCQTRRLTIRFTSGHLTGRRREHGGDRQARPERAPAPSNEIAGTADVAAALLAAPEVALCASCLAFTAGCALLEARCIAATLARDDRFASHRGPCARCRRVGDVIGVAGASSRGA
jgi:hypothetical protein